MSKVNLQTLSITGKNGLHAILNVSSETLSISLNPNYIISVKSFHIDDATHCYVALKL